MKKVFAIALLLVAPAFAKNCMWIRNNDERKACMAEKQKVEAPPAPAVAPAAPPAAPTEADALEAQYKTCAKHFIPADKCTPEIYAQLKAKDEAPLDPKVMLALSAAKAIRDVLLNPDSLQVYFAWVTNEDVACIEIGGQNRAGGMSTSHYAYGLHEDKKHPGKDKMVLIDLGDGDAWGPPCGTNHLFNNKLFAGQDVTGQVKRALSDGK